MKLTLRLYVALALCLTATALAQGGRKTVTVSSVDQLLRAIGPNVEIVLKPGIFNLAKSQIKASKYIAWRNTYSGKELTIKGLSNLLLRGQDTEAASLLQNEDADAFVIVFQDCKSVELRNLNMDHGEIGACASGVAMLKDCQDFNIVDCYLAGSGSVGLSAIGGQGIGMRGTTIADCSSGAVSLDSCLDFSTQDCLLTRNASFPLIELSGASGVEFNSTQLSANYGDVVVASTTGDASALSFRDCLFSENEIEDWCRDEGKPVIIDSVFEENAFNPEEDGDDSWDNPEADWDEGLSGSMPAYYIHEDSGLAFLYPNSWNLDDDEGRLMALSDAEEAGFFFFGLGSSAKGMVFEKTPDKVFDQGMRAFILGLIKELDFEAEIVAVGTTAGLDYIPYRDYAGHIESLEGDVVYAVRLRIFYAEKKLWALCLFAEHPAQIEPGTEADIIMQTVDFAPRAD